MKSLNILVLTLALLTWSCNEKKITTPLKVSTNKKILNKKSAKIPVLNFGTFHMGLTSDATKTEFDEHDKENQKEVHQIAKILSSFKPTVIIVETVPEYNEKLQLEYSEYLKNPKIFFKNPSEIELLAYELGRLSGTKKIFGIDHKMGYNYNIGNEIKNQIDSTWYNKFYANPFLFFPEINVNEDSLSLLDKLKLTNHDKYLDFAITINADMLTHAGSKNGFEGADEAAKFYQRNLRMYSNLNRIDLNKNDRVFILMGAAHTAFFRDFISRSPKYEMVNTLEFLKI